MSSGKETPRQKMIGMMYLVLTALLALNVSKEILKGFVTVDESIEKSKLILSENNQRVQKAFEDYVKAGNYEAQPYLLKAIEAQKNIRMADSYIDSVKLRIVQKTEDPGKKDTSQLRFMDRLDDYDTPTYLLLGSDETSPITTRYSAKDLRSKLELLYTNLSTMLDNMQKNSETKLDDADLSALKQKLNTIKPVDRNIMDDGVKLNWELENFYHQPMAAVVTNLAKMQADMKNVESEFLHVFASASSKFTFKIDKLQAKVIAPTAYVLAGQPFKADIVLGASSSELTEERMKVLVGAEYDTLKKQLTVPGAPLAITDGMGKFESTTSATGTKNLKGVVVYKNPRGKEEYYPFDFSYMVAPPFTAVSADNMNIFYAGIENPISVSSAGFSPADVKVTLTGCGAEVKPATAGKYILTAKTSGTCTIVVSAKVNGSYQQQGPPKVFRVKDIPTPVLKLGGKVATTNLEFTRNEIKLIGGVGADSPGFMFPVNMVVKSFDLEIQGAPPITCSGSSFSQEVKTALGKMRVGQIGYFDNIKVLTPKGVIVPIAAAKIRIKS
ncbi:MAG: GldM family protein [Bacteroidota bacterium]